jgi:hypothetical protein
MDGSTNESIFFPLDKSKAEIRLLHLQPRVVARDEITCTLRLADLDTKDCEYEALSYEWGIATNRIFTVVINEEEVTIRENLWWALWYLRADEGESALLLRLATGTPKHIMEPSIELKLSPFAAL